MTNQHSTLLTQPIWRVIDHSRPRPHFEALDSFAVDDTLCASVGAGDSPATARLWVHDRTIVLGIQDSRLPQAAAGIDDLHGRGCRVMVRNSGGLAVPLDRGVLNLSLVLPVESVFLGIDLGYETMVALVKKMLMPYTRQVEAKEIVGSYCSGRYDLSIDGKKFAGISQRRTKGGMAVQIFLNVSGSGRERAQIIQRFYRLAIPDGQARGSTPSIRVETVASLKELLPEAVTMDTLSRRLIDVLQNHAERVVHSGLSPAEASIYKKNRQRLIERNRKHLGRLTVPEANVGHIF